MNHHRERLKRLAVAGLSQLPPGRLEQFEIAVRLSQGKGWAAGQVLAEATAALSLMAPQSSQEIVAIDCGANRGDWTQALLDLDENCRVFAFEPSPVTFPALRSRFEGVDRVCATEAAVSDHEGTSRLWANVPGSSLSSLIQRRPPFPGLDFQHRDEVRLVTLDNWAFENSVRPGLLKLDVEGHELSALKGARGLLGSCVQVVQFEFGGCNIDSRTYFRDFFEFFEEVGFRIYRLAPRGLVRLSHYRETDECFSATNFFAQTRRSVDGAGPRE